MRRFLLGTIGGAIAAVILLIGVVLAWRVPGGSRPAVSPSPSPSSAPASAPSSRLSPGTVTNETLLLTRDNESDGVWDEVLVVQGDSPRSVPVPAGAVRTVSPVTDGADAYILVQKTTSAEGRRGGESALVRSPLAGGGETVISDATPLVEPRDLFASPNGQVIAFFLDSREGSLTELWTYDPKRDKKRVSVERLSQEAAGPFWAPDGGFLLRDGTQLLRGSPQRTGADILPITRAWEDVPEGQTMLPSPGGTQVIYLTEGPRETTTLSLKVWDAREGREREVVKLPHRPAQLLGWSATGALVVAAGTDPVTLWEIRKDRQERHALEPGASSPVLSGDGTHLAYLTRAGGTATLVIIDMMSKREVRQVPLPGPARASVTSSPNAEEGVSASPYHLLQFLRSATGTAAAPQVLGATLADEDIVRYVMEHIREIAEAPAGEPISAVRVWFTSTPGAVYVDYRVGTVLWRRLVHVAVPRGQPAVHKVLGIFTPAEGEWTIARGSDLTDSRPARLYEFEPELGKWVQKGVGGNFTTRD